MHVHAPDMAALSDPQKTAQQSQTEPRCPACQGMGTMGPETGPGAVLGHQKICKVCGGTGRISPFV